MIKTNKVLIMRFLQIKYQRHFCLITSLLLLTLILLSMLNLVGCSSKSIPDDCEVPVKRTTFSFDQGTYPSDLDLFAKYHISPGDVLDVLFQIKRVKVDKFPITLYHTVSVKFVEIPDLSLTQEVMPNGKIALPYIGEIPVLGKTPSELKENLKHQYSSVLRDPEIVVTVPNFNVRIDQLRKDLHTAPRGLSKLVHVRPDGVATFPLIGRQVVARKTIEQVNEIIQKRYSSYLPGMKVDLFLHGKSGSVVYIVGEVLKSGTYEINKPITVLQALTLAGGFTTKAQLKNVIVFREHEKKRIARSLNLKSVSNVKTESQFFFLKPEDIVFVPKTRIASLGELMRQIADIALFNGVGDSVDWVGPNKVWGSGP